MEGGGTIERSFELARSGACRSLTDIRKQLSREGYSDVEATLGDSAIKKALSALIKAHL